MRQTAILIRFRPWKGSPSKTRRETPNDHTLERILVRRDLGIEIVFIPFDRRLHLAQVGTRAIGTVREMVSLVPVDDRISPDRRRDLFDERKTSTTPRGLDTESGQPIDVGSVL
jgi:hypothetical protein